MVPQFDPALEFACEAIVTATKEVALAVADARTADARWRQGSRDKEPAVDGALTLLGRFASHLDAHPRGAVDRKRFFPPDGRMHPVRKRSPRKILVAVEHVTAEIKKRDSGVIDPGAWHKEFTRAVDTLAPIVEQTDSARAARRRITPEVRQARAEWLQAYNATKCLVEAVLRLTGRLDLMPQVFHDLAVPSTAKVTEIPARA